MTIVRKATIEDREVLVTMAQHFVQQTAYGQQIPSDRDHLGRVTDQLLSLGIVFIAEAGDAVGMLAGLVYPHYMTGRQTANETAWWVEPSARGGRVARDLLAAFEQWARTQGAAVVEIGSWHPRLDRWYGRLGYVPGERVFRKEIA